MTEWWLFRAIYDLLYEKEKFIQATIPSKNREAKEKQTSTMSTFNSLSTQKMYYFKSEKSDHHH